MLDGLWSSDLAQGGLHGPVRAEHAAMGVAACHARAKDDGRLEEGLGAASRRE